MAKKIWNRDHKFEAQAKTNFMYRIGFLFGVLISWVATVTAQATLGTLALVAAGVVIVFTLWDARKIWKGK